MLLSSLYTDRETGEVDEVRKAEVLKIAAMFHRASIRRKRRVELVTKRFKSRKYFYTTVHYNRKDKYKDVPTILYEPNNGVYNLIDYMIKFLKEFTGKKYKYSEHKLITTEFVKYFKILVKPLPNNMMTLFEDLEGNKYGYDIIWFHLCKFVLKENV